jgi:hypothetical protein
VWSQNVYLFFSFGLVGQPSNIQMEPATLARCRVPAVAAHWDRWADHDTIAATMLGFRYAYRNRKRARS